jgi:hypothetical protein
MDGHASGLGAIHHRPFPMASGDVTPDVFDPATAELTFAISTNDYMKHAVLVPDRHVVGRVGEHHCGAFVTDHGAKGCGIRSADWGVLRSRAVGLITP